MKDSICQGRLERGTRWVPRRDFDTAYFYVSLFIKNPSKTKLNIVQVLQL